MNKPAGRLGAAVEAAASNTTEEQKRVELARAERAGWMGGQHASGYFAILSRRGMVVAQFEKEADRDAVLGLVKLESAAEKALKLIDDMMPGVRHIALQDYALLNEAPLAVKAALAAVAGRK